MKCILPISIMCMLLVTGCGSGATQEPTTAMIPTLTPYPSPTAVATPMPGVLYVVPAEDVGPISPFIFGSNYGPWAVVPFDMLDAAYNSGITVLRFPGGEWGDQNDVTLRQIDTFIGFCKQVGAIPYITVRLRGGTAEKAAAMVRYVNIEKRYDVSYWSIGNEPSLYEAAMHEVYDTVRFNKEWREWALAMKAVDPGLKLIGPEIHQFSYSEEDSNYGPSSANDSAGLNWMDEFLKANGDLVDIVSFHRYPFPVSQQSPPASIEDLRKNTADWDKYFESLRSRIREFTGRDLPIAITEFSSHYNKPLNGEATPDSHYHAIWMADVLGRMIRQNVFMANYWLLASYGNGGATGLIGAYGELRPSYYVYQMYKLFGDEQVYSISDDPDLSVYAAIRPDGSLTIMVINLSSEEKNKPIRIEGQAEVQAEAWLFDPTRRAENVGTVDLSARITVPPQSMTLYVVH